ncbi:MAG TPA: tryptophan synthase subunit alpha [Candidatus Omnitrophica bacterium]|nr:tryptophan synthase subunit alpha [Candidatus Omnitrophota bacterium]
MSRIQKKWQELKKKGVKAFIPFITSGDPSLKDTYNLVLELQRCGADIVELGVPFSDPIADGPVIQASAQKALQKDTSLEKIFQLVHDLRKKTNIPIALLSYYNPIFHYSEDKFVCDAVKSGVDGAIIADLPPEEAKNLRDKAKEKGLDTIFLLAPTSSNERIRKIINASTGFIYCVSVTGVTGVRNSLARSLRMRVQQIKEMTDTPVAVGFGVSNTETAEWVASFADGVIVGSAIVKIIGENCPRGVMIEKVEELVGELALAIHEQGR